MPIASICKSVSCPAIRGFKQGLSARALKLGAEGLIECFAMMTQGSDMVSEKQQAQGVIAQPIDQLTGLLSRVGIQSAIKAMEANNQRLVVAVEISRFGGLNSSMGSDLGDKIIVMISRRIKKLFPGASAIGRTNGDHFLLVFEDSSNYREEITRLQDFAQRPLAIDGEVIVLDVRIGVALYVDSDAESSTSLLNFAESALHYAKKNRLKVYKYDPSIIAIAKKLQQSENDLRVSMVRNTNELHRGIGNNEFELVYQPIISVWSGTVHSFEALLRWNHPLHGVISPAVFIPIAEQISIMDLLGAWVIRKACADAKDWPKNVDGTQPLVNINLSPTQFIEPELLIKAVHTALEETAILPSRVILEVTESAAFLGNMAQTLERFRALGCKTALDDFGTGYSSLTQLQSLPLDYIKLARSFISKLCSDDPKEDKRCEKLTVAILSLADSMSLIPIVEGIETESQLHRIRQFSCNLVQGYVYSKPMKLSSVADFMEQRQ